VSSPVSARAPEGALRRFARARTRALRGAARGIVCLFTLASCTGTDVVAKHELQSGCRDGGADCDIDAGTDSNACQAAACPAVSSEGAVCESGAIQVQAGDDCEAASGTQISRYVLCTCADLVARAPLRVDAFAGTLAVRASELASIGINGNLSLSAPGTLEAEILVGGQSELGQDVAVRRISESERPPCDCAPDALLDIGAVVRAREDDNDNAGAAIASDRLDDFRGTQTLTLECGRYYFTRLKGEAPLTIRTRGHVAIFVANNVELGDSLRIETERDGQVSLFVAGDMRVGGSLALGGDPNGAARVDLYLASTGTLEIAGSTEIAGRLYAPRAELVSTGAFRLYGSLFVRRAAPGGELDLHYDELARTAQSCGSLP
jgi:hypothetical protein